MENISEILTFDKVRQLTGNSIFGTGVDDLFPLWNLVLRSCGINDFSESICRD